jgi:hypothetical protein
LDIHDGIQDSKIKLKKMVFLGISVQSKILQIDAKLFKCLAWCWVDLICPRRGLHNGTSPFPRSLARKSRTTSIHPIESDFIDFGPIEITLLDFTVETLPPANDCTLFNVITLICHYFRNGQEETKPRKGQLDHIRIYLTMAIETNLSNTLFRNEGTMKMTLKTALPIPVRAGIQDSAAMLWKQILLNRSPCWSSP